MRSCLLFIAVVVLAFAGVLRADPTIAQVTHDQFQAVDSSGVGTYAETDKVVITGIILNNPEEILDPTPGLETAYMGGQWQIFIQGEGDDHAGTAVYMVHYYANVVGGRLRELQQRGVGFRVSSPESRPEHRVHVRCRRPREGYRLVQVLQRQDQYQ
jgi:hypothetical protein